MTQQQNSAEIEAPFDFFQGDTPVLVSMPHSGLNLTAAVEQGLTEKARMLPDTDWFIPQLYDFLPALGVSVISANYSRYVIDLNRPFDDKPLYKTKTTGLFPDILFDSTALFTADQQPDSAHQEACKQAIWQPYHQKIAEELARIKAKFGYAILFDAHSIAAQVPMLFDGTLADFNFGNNNGVSCGVSLVNRLAEIVGQSRYSQVTNGRFKGGYITRSFGQPENHIHAIQLELSQATYLADLPQGYHLDAEKQGRVKPLLQQLIESLILATV